MTALEPLVAAERFLHEQIPLTLTMGLRVIAQEAGRFALEAPVTPNRNHLHTAFGGSINALAILAGYGLLWLELRDTAAHVVVAQSSMRFLHPVRETIRALCEPPAPWEIAELKATLRAKGKARITLRVRVEENGMLAAALEGVFVAIADRSGAGIRHP